MKHRFLSAAVVALAAATIVACSKSSPTNPSTDGAATTAVTTPTPGTPGSGSGKLSVSLKDSPFSEATAVLVTFTEVSAHHSGGSWFTVPFANAAVERVCDLKQLQGSAQDILGVATLEAGHYTEIRLTVESAALYFGPVAPAGPCFTAAPTLTGTDLKPKADVNIPSGVIKLNRPFDLPADATLKMLLDFDGDQSIRQLGNGKYQMSPVISVVSVQ